MTPEEAAALHPDDVIEYDGALHRLGSVVKDTTLDGQVLKVAANSYTAGRWLHLVPRREPGQPLDPAAAERLAAARLAAVGLRGDMLMGDLGRPPGVPARPVS